MTQKMEDKGRKQSMITTFAGDIYIIADKTPDQVQDLIDAGGDMVRMPNGAHIHRKSISGIQDYHDYTFQAEQKAMHRKGNYIKRGEWHDHSGFNMGIKAHLERITGDLPLAIGSGKFPMQFEKPKPDALTEPQPQVEPLSLGSAEEEHGE